MRTFLGLLTFVGVVAVVFGVGERISLQSEITRQPAIVVMPQIINAWLIAGFGLVTAAIGAAGLAITDLLDRIAYQQQPPLAAPPAPIRDPGGPPHEPLASSLRAPPAADPQAPKRLCPSCDKLAPYANGVCQNCGWNYVEQRGPHDAGRRQAQPPIGQKSCDRCGKEVESWRLNCPHCGNQFGSVRPAGPIMKDRG